MESTLVPVGPSLTSIAKGAVRAAKNIAESKVVQKVLAATRRRRPAVGYVKNIPAGGGAIRSKRNGRRRGRRGRFSGNRDTMPISVSGGSHEIGYKAIGNPKHKEWGTGVRIQGTDILGTFQVPSSTTSDYIFTSAALTYGPNTPTSGFDTMYDLYTFVQPPGSGHTNSYRDKVMSLHPVFVNRLARETQNWGRYVYRSIEIFNEPISNTTEPVGYVVGLGHNVIWPLNSDQTSDITSVDVMELDKRASGAFYDRFSLKAGDYTGDKTWPCTIPIVTVGQGLLGTGSLPGGFVHSFINDTYQYFWVTRMASDGTGGGVTPGFRGFVYIRYVIDFYERETNTSDYMDTYNYIPYTGSAPAPSSSSPSSSSFKGFPAHLVSSCMLPGERVLHPSRLKRNKKVGPAMRSEPDSWKIHLGIKETKDDIPPPPPLVRQVAVCKDGPVTLQPQDDQKILLKKFLHFRKSRSKGRSSSADGRDSSKSDDDEDLVCTDFLEEEISRGKARGNRDWS